MHAEAELRRLADAIREYRAEHPPEPPEPVLPPPLAMMTAALESSWEYGTEFDPVVLFPAVRVCQDLITLMEQAGSPREFLRAATGLRDAGGAELLDRMLRVLLVAQLSFPEDTEAGRLRS